ncbi:MAG: TIGR00725 family protein [Candidatus Natronoplasma sp.]
MYVSVIGGDVESCSEKDRARAEKLGEKLAERGHVLVCGGRGGVMKAACKGAKKANGTTVGILPSGRREEANEYVDIPIVTGLGMLRNSLVVLNGDVVVAIDGSYGTLSEICMAEKYGKKILGLGTWQIDAVDHAEDVDDLLKKIEDVSRT